MRYFQRCISDITCCLTEDCTKQSLLGCQLCLSLRSNFTNKNISGTNLSTDADNSSVIQILKRIITDTRDITSDFLWSKLGVTGFCLIFLNMDRCIYIILNKSLT